MLTSHRTGGTGYIGGSVLHTIVTAHPEYDVTVLLRKVPQAFTSTYPNIRIVKGDYESAEIIAEEASKADVVVRKFLSHIQRVVPHTIQTMETPTTNPPSRPSSAAC